MEVVRPAPKTEHKPQKPVKKAPEKTVEQKIAPVNKPRIENTTDKLSSLPSMTRKNFSKPQEEKPSKPVDKKQKDSKPARQPQ